MPQDDTDNDTQDDSYSDHPANTNLAAAGAALAIAFYDLRSTFRPTKVLFLRPFEKAAVVPYS
jgi:hypothetical protein